MPGACETAAVTSSTITASAAGTWTLGDLPVNRVGFGAMRLTGSAAFHLGTPREREGPIAVLRRAVELGVNHIDTAAFYFSSLRSANELINSALGGPYPDDLVVVTKVGPHREYSGSGARPPAPTSCAAMSRRTCGSWAATTSTSSICAGCARNPSPSTSARWPS